MDLVCQLNQIGSMICKLKDENKLKTAEKHIDKLHSELKKKKKTKRKRKRKQKSTQFSFDPGEDYMSQDKPIMPEPTGDFDMSSNITQGDPKPPEESVTPPVESVTPPVESVTPEESVTPVESNMLSKGSPKNVVDSEGSSDQLMLEDVDKVPINVSGFEDSLTRRYG